MNCTACADGCSNCLGDKWACLACSSGFELMGSVCISNFNFLVSITFNVDLATFQNNFVIMLNQIANISGVSVNQITILSIVQGSVTVNMAITSPNAANSNAANTVETNLDNALKVGNNFGGMSVAKSSVTTEGNPSPTPDDGGSGLSRTTIILLATLIPIGVLCTFYLT